MNIEVLMVANGASVENSLLSVQGGGWEHYNPLFFPWTVRGAVAGIGTLEPSEVGSISIVDVEVSDQHGHVVQSVGSMTIDASRPAAKAGVPMRFPFFAPLMFVVTAPTVVKVALSSEGAELAAVTFAVHDPVPDAPPSA